MGQLDECVVSGALWALLSISLSRMHKTGEVDKCVASVTVCIYDSSSPYSVSLWCSLPWPVWFCTLKVLFSVMPSPPILLLIHQTAFPRNMEACCLLPLLVLCSTTDKHAELRLSGENMPAGFNPHHRFLSASYIFRSVMMVLMVFLDLAIIQSNYYILHVWSKCVNIWRPKRPGTRPILRWTDPVRASQDRLQYKELNK